MGVRIYKKLVSVRLEWYGVGARGGKYIQGGRGYGGVPVGRKVKLVYYNEIKGSDDAVH